MIPYDYEIRRFMERMWCAPNHPVSVSESSRYLWCTFVCPIHFVVYRTHTKCITGEWRGGSLRRGGVERRPVPYMPVRVTRGVLVAHVMHVRLIANEPSSTAWLLFLAQYHYGTILVTLCSMVWDWRLLRAGPILLYWPTLLAPILS